MRTVRLRQDQFVFADAVERPAIAMLSGRLATGNAGALFAADKANASENLEL
jgi:hypothetical protein